MQLGDYCLTELVRDGTETRVCRAAHRPSGEKVVLKFLTGAVPTSEVVGRLMHEVRILEKLAAVSRVARPREILRQRRFANWKGRLGTSP